MEESDDQKLINIDEKTIILRTNPSDIPRLTPTGKISYAKTRVYTQRYRKEWEEMSDFKEWLTSVAHEPTRAYCKFCKKDLHAHRLSLLKHMCTMKHQRSALTYQSTLSAKKKGKNKKPNEFIEADFVDSEENEEEIEGTEEVEYAFEELETEELDESDFPEHKYARNIKEEERSFKERVKTIKIEDNKRDTLAEAMAHVHGEILEENVEHLELDMECVSETVETTDFADMNEPLSEGQNLSFVSLNSSESVSQFTEVQSSDNEELQENIEFVDTSLLKSANVKKLSVPAGNTITFKPNSGKTILLSNGSKAVTLASGKLAPATQYVIGKLKTMQSDERKMSIIPVSPKSIESASLQQEASTSQMKKGIKGTRSPLNVVKKPTISTHVLDMTKGQPIGGLQVSLYKLLDGRWTFVNECNTSTTGRCNDLIGSDKNPLTNGRYKLHFDVDKYFSLRKIESLYPFIEIVFDVKNPVISYHIPILLSPFSYTTYRGMDR